MEKEKKKRGREEEKRNLIEKNAKKQDLTPNRNITFNFNDKYYPHDDCDSCDSSDDHSALGVFDFPWLHEGMISKAEDWTFEDTFSSSLNDPCSPAGGMEFTRQCLYDSPKIIPTTCSQCDHKFEEKVIWPLKSDGELELEGFDCVWNSLVNQSLL